MPSADVIILEYVCPCLGMIAANLMFAAPLRSVRDAVARGTLGALNPTPWAVMTGNCIGWVTYSYLIDNLFVFFANAPGLVVSVWLNMAAAKLQYTDGVSRDMRDSFVQLLDDHRRSFRHVDDPTALGGADVDDNAREATALPPQRRPQRTAPSNHDSGARTFAHLRKMAFEVTIQRRSIPAPHEIVVVCVVCFWIAVISLLYFLSLTLEQWQVVLGFVVNANLLFFYGAPLSTIFAVLKTRDASSIHPPTMVLNTANAVFWTAFGFGTRDWFIVVPNGLGALLGFVQMMLRLAVPSRDTASASSLAPSVGSGEAETEKGELELGGARATAAAPSSPSTAAEDSSASNR